jgi:AraC-like DNA-binding protein
MSTSRQRARWCANWDWPTAGCPKSASPLGGFGSLRRNASDRGSDARREHERDIVLSAPIQYQKQVRLQEAEAKLLASPGDVAAVGYAVGYDSPSQFQPRVPSAVRRAAWAGYRAAAGNVAEREPGLESFSAMRRGVRPTMEIFGIEAVSSKVSVTTMSDIRPAHR